jgi:hypothetical protein
MTVAKKLKFGLIIVAMLVFAVAAFLRYGEDPAVIERILAHLNDKAPSAGTALLPEGRGPPQARLFD